MNNQTQINEIKSIFEGWEITVNDKSIYIQALDTDAAICIYIDTDNNIYTVSELEDINDDQCYSTEELYSFEDLVEYINENYL